MSLFNLMPKMAASEILIFIQNALKSLLGGGIEQIDAK
jgi:hypothetical protein